MSHQFENELAKRLYRDSDDSVKVYRCGYSGNGAYPLPDILVTTPYEKYALEVKRAATDYCRVEEDDIEQLVECQGPNTSVWLVCKFTHREPLVARYVAGAITDADGQFSDKPDAEKFVEVIPDCFDPRVTDSGTLVVTRPSTDEWMSSQAGRDDHVTVLSGLGIKNESSMSE